MKTFADVKRRIKIGTSLECVDHSRDPKLVGDIRVLEHVQGNGIAYRMKDGRLGWLFWPKDAAIKIVDPDTFAVHLWDDKPDWRIALKFVADTAK